MSTSTSRRPTGRRAPTAPRSGSARGRSPGTADRFAARRRDAQWRQAMRRLRLVLGLALVSSLAVGVIAFVNSSWFDVDSVEVSGHQRASVDEIVMASGIEVGDGLLEIDLGDAAEAVELVPWVGTAEVTRSWSGRVAIDVVERPPSVAIPAGAGFALVDDHGRQLEVIDRRPDGYLPIRGIEGSGVPGEAAPALVLPIIAALDALPPGLAERIGGVAVRDLDIHLELRDGGQANLGDGSDLGPKLQAFETILARVDLRCLDTIDVRVPSAPVVTRTADLPPGEPADQEPDSPPVDC